MIILVGLHIGSDWNDAGINSALITLDNKAIKHILKLAKRAKDGQTVLEYDYTPELGTSQVDLQNESPYRNVADLSAMMGDTEVFTSKQSEDNDEPIRTECVQLHVDKTDFWWEGMFKHTDVRWETRMIPLSFLPQDLRPKKSVSKPKADLNMTSQRINDIKVKIAAGISQGLNVCEIEATFNRHVTKAQLIRVIWDLIERQQ
jgi:hypothetical protein